MATKGMRQPFYVHGKTPICVCIKIDGQRVEVYDCATLAVASEIASAMNLVFQCITYGLPDPILKAQFLKKYGHLNYGSDDVQEFAGKMMALAVIPQNFEEQPVHSVH